MKCPKCKTDLVEKPLIDEPFISDSHYFVCRKCCAFEYKKFVIDGDYHIQYKIFIKDKIIESIKYGDNIYNFTELSQILHCCSAKIVTINQFSELEDYEDIKSYEKIFDRLMKLVVFS
ncbi:hypothetical protein UFOVP1290_128 [uncultured Caudovirales phage]|uniref:Uncharacterized protein n=1 Tax=uncultured Caudovirales phage TaxID=2100421 RepID=A0A6J5RSF3_9CAUD|nr:hypothetical protein UFOVP1290_128 [uncultured Caudovirales phage]